MKAFLFATLVGMAVLAVLIFAYVFISWLFEKCFGEDGWDAVLILVAIFLVAVLPAFIVGVVVLRVIFGVQV